MHLPGKGTVNEVDELRCDAVGLHASKHQHDCRMLLQQQTSNYFPNVHNRFVAARCTERRALLSRQIFPRVANLRLLSNNKPKHTHILIRRPCPDCMVHLNPPMRRFSMFPMALPKASKRFSIGAQVQPLKAAGASCFSIFLVPLDCHQGQIVAPGNNMHSVFSPAGPHCMQYVL